MEELYLPIGGQILVILLAIRIKVKKEQGCIDIFLSGIENIDLIIDVLFRMKLVLIKIIMYVIDCI